jgi:hypothetical protein
MKRRDNMYVIIVNDGVYECKLFENLDDVEKVLNDWSNGEEMRDEDGEIVDVYDLLECGSMGECVDVYNKNMVEMGDDYVGLSVVELVKYGG